MSPCQFSTSHSAESTQRPLLSARGLCKRFGAVEALRGADLDVYGGEIVALVGDNGAGKSTFIKLLTGSLVPDAGSITAGGHTCRSLTPRKAMQLGISVVYQDLGLMDRLNVAENVCMGREPLRWGWCLDRPRMHRETSVLLNSLGLHVPSTTEAAGNLSGGQRQGVAIARALYTDGSVLIADEPTAATGVRETAHILGLLNRVRAQGRGVLWISHNLPQVLELADRVCVLRRGQVCWTGSAAETDLPRLVGVISGGCHEA